MGDCPQYARSGWARTTKPPGRSKRKSNSRPAPRSRSPSGWSGGPTRLPEAGIRRKVTSMPITATVPGTTRPARSFTCARAPAVRRSAGRNPRRGNYDRRQRLVCPAGVRTASPLLDRKRTGRAYESDTGARHHTDPALPPPASFSVSRSGGARSASRKARDKFVLRPD